MYVAALYSKNSYTIPRRLPTSKISQPAEPPHHQVLQKYVTCSDGVVNFVRQAQALG